MKPIQALVGHSFADDDKEIVTRFVDHFDSLARLQSDFGWDRAILTKPKSVSEKVRDHFKAANTFIAICTKHEITFAKSDLRQTMFRKELRISRNAYQYKSSDWILQEIGYAAGKEMNVIVLVEEGVRPPEGILGDLEYIPFLRENLDAAFVKLTDAISSLVPDERSSEVLGTESRQDSSEVTGSEDPKSIEEPPDTNWPLDRFHWELISAAIMDQKERFGEIDLKFRKTDHCKDKLVLNSWEVHFAATRLEHFGEGSLIELEKVVREKPSARTIIKLAIAFSKFGEHEKAANLANEAFGLGETQLEKLDCLSRAAKFWSLRGEFQQASDSIDHMRQIGIENSEQSAILYKTLAQYFKASDQRELKMIALEALAALFPDDVHRRFRVGFDHSDRNNPRMAAYHYSRTPASIRDGTTWNNLGVAFEGASFHAKSIEALLIAKKKGSSLAMNNLAKRYLSAGFVEDALRLCQEALRQPEPTSYAGETLTIIQNRIREEEDNFKKDQLRSMSNSSALVEIGAYLSKAQSTEIIEKWQLPTGPMRVTVEGNRFRAMGNYQVKSGALSAAFGNVQANLSGYRIEIEGVISGRLISAKKVSKRIDGNGVIISALLSESKSNMFLCLEDDEVTFTCYEEKAGESYSTYKMTADATIDEKLLPQAPKKIEGPGNTGRPVK